MVVGVDGPSFHSKENVNNNRSKSSASHLPLPSALSLSDKGQIPSNVTSLSGHVKTAQAIPLDYSKVKDPKAHLTFAAVTRNITDINKKLVEASGRREQVQSLIGQLKEGNWGVIQESYNP